MKTFVTFLLINIKLEWLAMKIYKMCETVTAIFYISDLVITMQDLIIIRAIGDNFNKKVLYICQVFSILLLFL